MKLGMTDLLEQTPVNSDGRGRRVNQDVSCKSDPWEDKEEKIFEWGES